jgi:cytoskeletal protein RodZ
LVILHRDGATRRDVAPDPASVPEIGRFLRRERTHQALSIEEVSARMGVSADSLADLEAGTVDRLPDRVHTLKLLRRYADFLNLPGERYVLVLVEHWPSSSLAGAVVTVRSGATSRSGSVASSWPEPARGDGYSEDTETVPSVPTGWTPVTELANSRSARATAAPTSWSPVPPLGQDPNTAQVPRVVNLTGPLPVAPSRRRRERSVAANALRLLVVLLTLALVAGIAGIIVNRARPQWLKDLGITRPPPAVSAPTSSPTTSTPSASVFTEVSSAPGTATFAVPSRTFTVTVSAVGGASWVEAQVPDALSPVFAGIVPAGGTEPFVVHQSLSIQVGSAAARVSVTVGKRVANYLPPATPFSMTFQSGL